MGTDKLLEPGLKVEANVEGLLLPAEREASTLLGWSSLQRYFKEDTPHSTKFSATH